MAYANKYEITMATKSGSISTLYLMEDDYAGAIIEYPAVSLQLQYIPKSDDLFEPIYVSQLNVVIDVTDDDENMPNLTTLNDREYQCELYYDNTLEWKGWAFSDFVDFGFSTGRKQLRFNCIDGLGMLEKIKFPVPENYVLSDFNQALFYITTALKELQFDNNLDIITGISYYADGMDDRTDDAYADPIYQSYLNYGTFIKDDRTIDDCLTVLTKIVKGFGARLFQADATWYIVAVSQFAQASYYFTKYDKNGDSLDAGSISNTNVIEGYTGNTTDLFFVDNSQLKILRKGYNKVKLDKQIEYPSNYITNWDLKEFISGGATYGWTAVANGGLAFIVAYPTKLYNSYFLQTTAATSPYYVSIKPDYFPKIAYNEVAKLSFDVSLGNPFGGSADALFIIKIFLQTPSAFYTIDENKMWSLANTYYLFEPYDPENTNVNFNISCPPAPATGTIYFEYILAKTPSTLWKTTVPDTYVENFSFTIEPAFTSVTTISELSATDEYVLDIDLDLGYNDITNGSFSYRGFLADSTGLNLKNWYRQEYSADKYRSLSELVIKQYSNNLNKNIINIDSTIMGMNTSEGRFSAAMRLTIDDTDPAQISVSNKKYILGNSTIDLFNDTIQSTLLDINDNNIETNIYTLYSSNSAEAITIPTERYRGIGWNTSSEAYDNGLSASTIFTASTADPDLGDIFYEDYDLNITFNGSYLWYKVETVFPNTKVYQIRIDGVIIGVFT